MNSMINHKLQKLLLKPILLACFLTLSLTSFGDTNIYGWPVSDIQTSLNQQSSAGAAIKIYPKPPASPSFAQIHSAELRITAVTVSTILSVLCLIRLWRRSDYLIEKIFWTLLIPIPLIGPAFFAAFFSPPSIQDASEQARLTPGVLTPGTNGGQ